MRNGGGGTTRTQAPKHPPNARFAKSFGGLSGGTTQTLIFAVFYWAKKSRAKFRAEIRAKIRAEIRAKIRAPNNSK